eukprot:10063_1
MSEHGETVTVGDDVDLTNDLSGTVRFIGTVYQRKGIYYGIELSKSKGKTNGTISNIRYFKCKIKRGLFLRRSRITHIHPKQNAMRSHRIGINELIQITINNKNAYGNVRYIGIPQKTNQIYYGIQLRKPSGNCNGLFNGIKYFHTKKNHAIFIKANSKQIKYPINKNRYYSSSSCSSSSYTSEYSSDTQTDSDSDSNSNSDSDSDSNESES